MYTHFTLLCNKNGKVRPIDFNTMLGRVASAKAEKVKRDRFVATRTERKNR